MSNKRFTIKPAIILFLAALLISSTTWKVAVLMHFTATSATAMANTTSDDTEDTSGFIQGVWVSLYDYKSAGLYNKSKSKFTSNANKYFKKLKKDGINTIYFHTVPCNDAIYPSEYLSWSPYMFKSEPGYDPLEILVNTAHKHKISFHAWINPYRKTLKKVYNPGKESSTNRIVRIIKEIIENYDVDGIHFDDYFYPARTKGTQLYNVSIAKRKKAINKMVKKVYSTIKDYDEELLFGISPAGNAGYAESIGCDLKTWLNSEGYMDYIIPQIYWSDQYIINGKITTLFTNRLNQWIKLDKNGTPMYIGLGLCLGGGHSSSDIGWNRKSNNIVTQIKQLKRKDCDGFVLFSSASLYSDTAKKEVKNYRSYINSQ